MNEIMVSVNCLVYNHGPYLRQCIDGFLMQKTNFNYEVLIHDDASTDDSAEIIREYERKYPQIIKPIYQVENQRSKGINIQSTLQIPRTRGKYIAYCEGDDYWIDPLKLQKQVDFMEQHPFCSACYGRNMKINSSDGSVIGENCCKNDAFLSLEECFFPPSLPHLSTCLVKTSVITDQPAFFNVTPVGDVPRFHWQGIVGSVYSFSDTFSCYRVHVPNSWTSRMNHSPEMQQKHRKKMTEFYEELDQYTDYKYHEYFSIKIDQYNIYDLQKNKDLLGLLSNKQFRHFNPRAKVACLTESFFPKVIGGYRNRRYNK